MADRSPQFDLARESNDRLSGASDTWDEGAAGAILTSEAFESADSGSAEFSLSAAESSDTASVVMGAGVVLAASEQPDTITATLVQGANLALSTSEAPDTVAMSVDVGSVGFALSATEAADTMSGEFSPKAVSFGSAFGEPLYGWPPKRAAEIKKDEPAPAPRAELTHLSRDLQSAKNAVAKIQAQLAGELADLSRSQQALSESSAVRGSILSFEAALSRAVDQVSGIEAQIAAIHAEIRRQQDNDDEDVLLLAA